MIEEMQSRTLPLRAVGIDLELVYRTIPIMAPPTTRASSNWPALPRVTILHADGVPPDRQVVRAALLAFMRDRAAEFIPPLIRSLAQRNSITPPPVIRFGAQRSRWASRSSSGTISVNVILMCLPRQLVEHVLLHELCHVEHMDHSPRFWSRLREMDPLSQAHNAAVKNAARQYIPAWFSALL